MNAAKRVVNASPSPELALPQDVLGILETVIEERDRAMAKWGVQSHPDGTGGKAAEALRDAAREDTDEAAAAGTVTWKKILLEEVREAFAETDIDALDAELMQVMQVCCVWREDLARRRAVSLLGTTKEVHDDKVAKALSAQELYARAEAGDGNQIGISV